MLIIERHAYVIGEISLSRKLYWNQCSRWSLATPGDGKAQRIELGWLWSKHEKGIAKILFKIRIPSLAQPDMVNFASTGSDQNYKWLTSWTEKREVSFFRAGLFRIRDHRRSDQNSKFSKLFVRSGSGDPDPKFGIRKSLTCDSLLTAERVKNVLPCLYTLWPKWR